MGDPGDFVVTRQQFDRWRELQDAADVVVRQFRAQWEDVAVEEHHDAYILFSINKGNISLADIFEFIEAQRNVLGIDSYPVSQLGLEAVFNNFVNANEAPPQTTAQNALLSQYQIADPV